MNILIMSNSMGHRYGYSVVSDNIVDALNKKHEIAFLGMQSCKSPHKDENNVIRLGVRYSPWCGDVLADYLRVYKSDAFMSICDIWLKETEYMPLVCKKLKIPYIAHATINSTPLSPMLHARFSMADFIVAPSKYNQKMLEDVGLGPKTTYIPHGVDADAYKPDPEGRKQMREQLNIPEDTFVVLSVQRNKGMQKSHPKLIKAWKLLLDREPSLREKGLLLILHDPIEPDGFRSDYLRDRIMLQKNMRYIWAKPNKEKTKIIATYEGDPEGMRHNANIGFDQEEMVKIFNCADIHVVPSAGESFSLPTIESLACGKPNIMGNHTTGSELIGEPKTGLLADVWATETTNLISDTALVNPVSIMEKIHTLYKDEELREKLGDNARKHALKYQWKDIKPLWLELFDRVHEYSLQVDYNKGWVGI